MSMFCFQCQETAQGTGCTVSGVCGKKPETAGYQDLLIFTLRGIALYSAEIEDKGLKKKAGEFTAHALFSTITNSNFDNDRISTLIDQALLLREELRTKYGKEINQSPARWKGPKEIWLETASGAGVLGTANEDIRSLRELSIYGIKGISAYYVHALNLGFFDQSITDFIMDTLSFTWTQTDPTQLTEWVLKTGEYAVKTMALLDQANTSTFGKPEITEVKLDVGTRPGILISGHDLKDLKELLEQTKNSGIDIYTHSEMLPAHYYPEFKKYDHFYGNYGNAWWQQDKEFDSFNGAILMTTNCIVPVKDTYKDRIFTTGMAGYPGVPHIEETSAGKPKDFSSVIARAKKCAPPTELETGTLTGGFAHDQVFALADKIVDAVKSGAIKKFVVMGGCDGRQKKRSYFTDVAKSLPDNTVILTAGCAKYRYNKLDLGSIGGIPRVLDAGQCNDSYSLAIIALKLKEIFGLSDVNDLPLAFDIAWYEQKAVAVLLALLFLGFKKVRIGPTLPAFVSPGVGKVLVETFGILVSGEVEEDVKSIIA